MDFYTFCIFVFSRVLEEQPNKSSLLDLGSILTLAHCRVKSREDIKKLPNDIKDDLLHVYDSAHDPAKARGEKEKANARFFRGEYLVYPIYCALKKGDRVKARQIYMMRRRAIECLDEYFPVFQRIILPVVEESLITQ